MLTALDEPQTSGIRLPYGCPTIDLRRGTQPTRARGPCASRALVLALCALLGSCSRVEAPSPTPQPSFYRLVADDASRPLMQALARAYQERQPWVIFTVEHGSAAFVAEQLASNQAQLGALATLPSGSNWWLTDLAADAVAILAHEQNTRQTFSLAELRAIFAGERNQWSDFGVSGLGDIKVAVREDGEATRNVFDHNVMGDRRLTLDALLMPSADIMLRYVALNPGALGYVPLSRLAQQRLSVRAIPIAGVSPTPQTVASGEYALTFPVYFIAAGEPTGSLRDFVLWALREEGRQVTASMGYSPLP